MIYRDPHMSFSGRVPLLVTVAQVYSGYVSPKFLKDRRKSLIPIRIRIRLGLGLGLHRRRVRVRLRLRFSAIMDLSDSVPGGPDSDASVGIKLV